MSISIEYINITKYVCLIDTIKVAVSLIPFINITVAQTYSFASYHTKNGPGEPTQKSSVKPRDYAYLQIRIPKLVQARPLLALPLDCKWPSEKTSESTLHFAQKTVGSRELTLQVNTSDNNKHNKE